MSKLSMRKLSVLGLVLMGASAVTAAIIPNKVKSDSPRVNNGALINSTNPSLKTCIAQDGANQCTATAPALTATTVAPAVTSGDRATVTATPTSFNNAALNTSAGG